MQVKPGICPAFLGKFLIAPITKVFSMRRRLLVLVTMFGAFTCSMSSVFASDSGEKEGWLGLKSEVTASGWLLNRKLDRVVVVSTTPGGPAELAGVRSGDEIIAVDGRPLKDQPTDLWSQKMRTKVGQTLLFRLSRRSTPGPLDVTLVAAERQP